VPVRFGGFDWRVHSVGSYAWKAALVAGVVVGGLWTAAHGVAGVAWADVALVLRGVSLESLALLSGIWLLGLGVYSIVLSAAMPGLGMRRGLLLNLSGSAVANVVPLGGAVATALNWRMARTWGHSDSAFVTFCVLTNALDVLTKLLLPVVGVAALSALSVHVAAPLYAVTGVCAGIVVLAAAWHVLSGRLSRHGEARHVRATSSVRRRVRSSSLRVRDLFAGQWRRLVPGSLGYIAAQVALLYVSFRAVGLDAPVTIVVMAAAIERLGTLVPITPGGTGIAEIGTIAWLLAAGLDPVEAVAGVLLYRVFLVALEIPVGGLLLGAWALLRRNGGARRTAGVVA
jgi:putative heme transporter